MERKKNEQTPKTINYYVCNRADISRLGNGVDLLESDMTDIEIDKALALAIGWKEFDMILDHKAKRLCFDGPRLAGVFDHRDWNVIGPIAERYRCFPEFEAHTDQWFAITQEKELEFAETPQKAIALAVIEGAKK